MRAPASPPYSQPGLHRDPKLAPYQRPQLCPASLPLLAQTGAMGLGQANSIFRTSRADPQGTRNQVGQTAGIGIGGRDHFTERLLHGCLPQRRTKPGLRVTGSGVRSSHGGLPGARQPEPQVAASILLLSSRHRPCKLPLPTTSFPRYQKDPPVPPPPLPPPLLAPASAVALVLDRRRAGVSTLCEEGTILERLLLGAKLRGAHAGTPPTPTAHPMGQPRQGSCPPPPPFNPLRKLG